MNMAGRRVVLTALACAAIATVAGIAVAANNPAAFDPIEDESGRPSTLSHGIDVGATPPPPATESRASPNPLWGIPLTTLSATRERPLFSPSRRPPMATAAPSARSAKAAAPPDSLRPPLDLLGVITGKDDGYAVFINTTSHDVVRLRTGEGHEGWILQSVNRREAVLKKSNRSAVMALPQPSTDKK
jgi:hypothetical protein